MYDFSFTVRGEKRLINKIIGFSRTFNESKN